jgi:TRAP transporter TAXI family solute receptor
VLAAVLALAAGSSASGCEPDGPPDPNPTPSAVRIATGNAGGVYLEYGRGIAEAIRQRLPQLSPDVLETAASKENLRMLANRRADVAFTLADVTADVVADRRAAVVALARLYENYVQLVVVDSERSSQISSAADLAGRTVSIGAAGSGTAVIAERVLRVAGLDPTRDVHTKTLDLQASTGALASGEVDAMFWSGGLPTAAIFELRAQMSLRLVDLSGVTAKLTPLFGDFYTESVVPASTYGQRAAVTTVSVPNYLVVRPDLDPELAYALTWLIFTERSQLIKAHQEAQRLDLRSAIATHPLHLHPGAARYYRAAKN